MILTPKHIIFIAVSNYLTAEDSHNLRTALSKNKRYTTQQFITTIEKYFDFKALRDKPMIPEDIWLFNYLMYDNTKNNHTRIFEIGEKINISGSFKKTKLIKQYEKKIIIPQLRALQEANMIIAGWF